MNGRIQPRPSHAGGASGSERSAAALVVAIGVGVVALIWPPGALLLLALLAAHALMRTDVTRADWPALLAPLFAALAVGAFVGVAGAIGTVFIWRLVADTRWSIAEAARLAVASGGSADTTQRALTHAWLTPLFGLSVVAYTAPHMVAGLPLDLPHVPAWVPIGLGALTACGVFDWALRRAADWRLGELAAAPAVHLLAHHGLFLLAFGLRLDVSAGVVALMAWRLAYAAPIRLPQASFTAVP